MIKKLCTILLFSLLAHVAAATAIVIVVTPQYILIGADSKRQWLDGNAVVQSEQEVCKIQRAGNYCFAIAGYTSSQATGFSAEKIIAYHLQHAASYETAMQRIKEEIKTKLTKEIRYQQQRQPQTFAQITNAKEALLEVVVLSMKEGIPQMEIIGFETSGEAEIAVGSYTARCPGDCPEGSQQLYFMGSYDGMEQYLAKRQLPIAAPESLVKTLIMEQAKVTPRTVGAPINMIRFSANGMEWLH